MDQDLLSYELLVQEALRSVVRSVLAKVAGGGMPGDHHFYITFRTRHPGVAIPLRLHETYPEEMTIVLQHQFFGLEIKEEAFEVTLSFNRRLERLRVPFAAVSAFADPSVNFGLQFQTAADKVPAPAADATTAAADKGEVRTADGKTADGDPGSGDPAADADPDAKPAEKVVSLDAFRKK
ncbi:MAG: SspB family protein [Alphaproteobacteria bacterium]